MGHHKLVQPKMGGSWVGRARALGAAAPPASTWSRPWAKVARALKITSHTNAPNNSTQNKQNNLY